MKLSFEALNKVPKKWMITKLEGDFFAAFLRNHYLGNLWMLIKLHIGLLNGGAGA